MSLSNYLQKHDLTYEQFGDLVGVTGTTIYRYIAGLRFPKRPILMKMKAVTNGDVNYDSFPQKPKKSKRTK